MPDVYANITSVAHTVVEQIADVLELRATDPQQRAMREAYLSEVAFPPNARVLDIGCGTGALTRVLAKWPNVSAVVGLDPSPILLDRARQRAVTHSGLTFEEGDARALPFDAASFNLTLFHTTLCHVPEPERALVSRGLDTLTGSRRIGRDVADSLRAEARRRADAGEFFGHIGYVSVVGRKPSRA